jgi:acetylornithine/N-succinyldiaminopimelate aminotransferase
MLGIELNSSDLAQRVVAQMLERRIIINRTSETVLRLLPPFLLERQHVETAVKAFDEIFSAALAGAAPAGEKANG